ncbi:AraC family transcriptional regulator [Flavobacterium daejeonense]|uniref:AraC family transcriptional regulator n=1 Tax=Flavobacterium daejeonense TaxID=350893 RepID=UPI000A5FC2CD|nr:helix-turn-helix transcriptional regulator [Flavobacterium daejeonense]
MESNHQAKSLNELYGYLGLPTKGIQTSEGFTIHNLKDTGFNLPYESPSFRPDYFSFLFVKDGTGKYTIDDHSFEVEQGTIYFTNPSNFRTFSWKAINDVYLITFDEAFLKKYVGRTIFEDFPFLLTETISPQKMNQGFYKQVDKLFAEIKEEFLSDSDDKCKIIGHLLGVLLFRIKAYFWKDYNPIYEGNRSSHIVKVFKRMLETHYRDLNTGKTETVFKVQDYANAQNLNPNYLSNVIKSKTGKPITTWITEKTITEARLLLEKSALSIKEISYRLGFSETAHFSNYFKKHTAQSPAEYRKQH